MQLKTPKFWNKKGLWAFVLLPFSLIYFCVHLLKNFLQESRKISKPVICVGNLIAGGSGKTPVAIALGKILREIAPQDFEFAYLSKGYMGDGAKFVDLRDGKHLAENVGDEPMLLIDIAPTFVAKKRLFGAEQIDNIKKISAVILDDGMQNNSLKKDLVILVVDGKIGFGNGFMIPAGPMREPLLTGLKKADFVVVIGNLQADLQKKLQGKKVVLAKLVVKNIADFSGKKLFAFCGLAYPQKFFSTLTENGLDVVETRSFPDHYFYNKTDLEKMCDEAEKNKLQLITTKKDSIKFPLNFQKRIPYLDIDLEFDDRDFVKQELKRIMVTVPEQQVMG